VFPIVLSHYQLGAALKFDPQFAAQLRKHLQSGYVEACLQAVGFYIEACVHHSAVCFTDPFGNITLFFQQGNFKLKAGELAGNSTADYTSTDDKYIKLGF
jgi:hypothetical protein